MGTAQAGDHLFVEARVRIVHPSRPRYCPDYHLIVTMAILLCTSKAYRLEDCVLKLSVEFLVDSWHCEANVHVRMQYNGGAPHRLLLSKWCHTSLLGTQRPTIHSWCYDVK